MQFGQITVTDDAATRIFELISNEAQDEEGLALRAYIVGGGCSGFQYCFSFDTPKEDDIIATTKLDDGASVAVIVDSLSIQYLNGATIDYVKDIKGERFVINNPNASGTCGCGESFSV